jgi:hypothetical protein
MELNTMQNFWLKSIHSPFWILASREKKKLSAGVLAGQDYSDQGEDVRKWKKIKLMEKQLPYSFPH